MSNDILEVARVAVEASIAPDLRDSYRRLIVLAAKENRPYAGSGGTVDRIEDCVVGAINRCFELRDSQTRPEAVVPAAMVLILAALGDAAKARAATVTKDELDRAAMLLADLILARFGVTAPMLHTAATRVDAIGRDPRKVEWLKQWAQEPRPGAVH